MANTRIYDEVEGLKFLDGGSGVAVGGVTEITTEQSYEHNIDSEADGVDFPSDASEAGQRQTFSVRTTDVLQGIALLNGANGFLSAEFFGHEAAAATYGKGSIARPRPHSLNFDAGKGQYATISVEGECEFPADDSDFADMETFVVGESAPTLRHPLRQWQPQSATLGALVAVHMESIGFRIPGRLLSDYSSGDVGHTAVVVAGYGLVTVELTIRDSIPATSQDLAARFLAAPMGNLVVPLEGVGDTADTTLTIRNVKFRRRRKTTGRGWTGWSLSGIAQGRDPSGSPPVIRTLNDATPANRLINFA